MFENFSREQFGRIAIMLVTLFSFFGLDIQADALTTTLFTISEIATFFLAALGYLQRYFKGDVTIGGFRK